MQYPFILSCESTVDLPYEYVAGREIPVVFYQYHVNGTDYDDDMGRDPESLTRFYKFIEEGNIPSTSQINQFTYEEFFRSLLEKGDVLHICLGTGMTQSFNNARLAAEELQEEFPNRKIVVIDSLCSSTGYGMLVDDVCDLRDAGKTLEEAAAWTMEHRTRIHHQFYAVDLQYYKRTGRMSGPTATLAAVLNICPIMRLSYDGKIIAYDKVRGKKNAVKRTIAEVEKHAVGGKDYNGKCWLCHSNRPEDALEAKAALQATFPNISGEIRICDIGTIIGSHCGPGTLAVFFMGDERVK